MTGPAAVAVLVVLAVAGVSALVVRKLLFREPYSPLQWLLYYYNRALVRFLWRAELPERLPLPPDQGAVIICNHRSSVDPCFIQAVAGLRMIHWMIADIYGANTLLGKLLEAAGTISVRRRGTDVGATKTAIRLAAQGELIGILPEGRINTTDAFMLKVRPGAVVVALRARVPILPCYIEGAPYHDTLWRPLFMPARVRLKIGEPIDLSPYYGRDRDPAEIAHLTKECIRAIARLAGRDDFQPELAGRNWAVDV